MSSILLTNAIEKPVQEPNTISEKTWRYVSTIESANTIFPTDKNYCEFVQTFSDNEFTRLSEMSIVFKFTTLQNVDNTDEANVITTNFLTDVSGAEAKHFNLNPFISSLFRICQFSFNDEQIGISNNPEIQERITAYMNYDEEIATKDGRILPLDDDGVMDAVTVANVDGLHAKRLPYRQWQLNIPLKHFFEVFNNESLINLKSGKLSYRFDFTPVSTDETQFRLCSYILPTTNHVLSYTIKASNIRLKYPVYLLNPLSLHEHKNKFKVSPKYYLPYKAYDIRTMVMDNSPSQIFRLSGVSKDVNRVIIMGVYNKYQTSADAVTGLSYVYPWRLDLSKSKISGYQLEYNGNVYRNHNTITYNGDQLQNSEELYQAYLDARSDYISNPLVDFRKFNEKMQFIVINIKNFLPDEAPVSLTGIPGGEIILTLYYVAPYPSNTDKIIIALENSKLDVIDYSAEARWTHLQ